MRGLSVSIIFFLPIYDDVHIYIVDNIDSMYIARERKRSSIEKNDRLKFITLNEQAKSFS